MSAPKYQPRRFWCTLVCVAIFASFLVLLRLPNVNIAEGQRELSALVEFKKRADYAGRDNNNTERHFPKRRDYLAQNKPFVFVGVLTAPGEVQRRANFRVGCALEWQTAIDAGLLRWRFFVGEPEDRADSDRPFFHRKGKRVSAMAHNSSLQLLAESTAYNDIDVGSYGDHYTTIHRKVFHIFREGVKADLDWEPDFVVKMDIDVCFKYHKFAAGWHDYMLIYRGHELGASAAQRATRGTIRSHLELVYRPFKKGDFTSIRGHRNGVISKNATLKDAPHLYLNFFSQFFGGSANHSIVYAQRTDFSRPILSLFSLNIFDFPVYTSQLGFNGTFEPYPSGPCYVLSAELARTLVSPQNRPGMVLAAETTGTTSEDVNIGYWVSRLAASQQLQIDILTIGGSFSHSASEKRLNFSNKSGQGDNTIRVKSNPGLCVSSEKMNSGDRLQLSLCSASEYDTFEFRSSDHTIRLKSKPGLCLDAETGKLQVGDAILVYQCSAAKHEQFEIRRSDNTIRIKSRPDLCLNAEGGQLTMGDAIVLYKCSGAKNEQFTVEDKRVS